MIGYKKIAVFIMALLYVFMVGCDDEPFPTTSEGEVVFKAVGQLAAADLRIEAGKNDVYLYTDYEVDATNLMQFSGAFQKNQLCTTDCAEKLKFVFNNYKTGTDFLIEDALFVGDYSLTPEITFGTTGYKTTYSSQVAGSFPFTYSWDFGDGNTSTAANPVHLYDTTIETTVLFTMTDGIGCTASFKDTLSLLNNAGNCAVDFSYTVQVDSFTGNTFFICTVVAPIPQNTYYWTATNSNGALTSTQTPFTVILPNDNLFTNICLTRTGVGCSSEVCKSINNNSLMDCDAKFGQTTETLMTANDTTFFSMMTIEYTDVNGVFYSSALGNQNGSTFSVLKVNDYKENERGQKNKKIEAAVNCKLYDVNGGILNFSSNELIFSVAIPD